MNDSQPVIVSAVEVTLEVPFGDVTIRLRHFAACPEEARQGLLDGLDIAYMRAREQALSLPTGV